MAKIEKIQARQILDSRGNPTVEVDVVTDKGFLGRAAVPSGASTGSREALELRDKDSTYYLGKSVRKAVGHIREEITPLLQGKDAYDQEGIDNLMIEKDGTGHPEIHYTNLYRTYQRWVNDGSIDRMLVSSIQLLAMRKLLDVSVIPSSALSSRKA